MKRIVAILVCGVLLALSNTAEARRYRGNNYSNYNNANYVQPARTAPAATTAAAPANTSTSEETTATSDVALASASLPVTSDPKPVSYDVSTAQGVANRMAASNYVGHFGGNRGYEGCGCGATPQAAYSICCYGNSGMATIDVGYARSASGMWYCCRRYR
ncbi:MAG TPA: hypothetical protein VGI40_21410 [Pirellulaceae bacterium]|jgi:hypothetical protein